MHRKPKAVRIPTSLPYQGHRPLIPLRKTLALDMIQVLNSNFRKPYI